MPPEYNNVEILERKLARAEAEIAGLERLIESKSRELYMVQEENKDTSEFLSWVLDSIQSAVLVTDWDGVITRANNAAVKLWGLERESALVGQDISKSFVVPGETNSIELSALVGEHHELILKNRCEEDVYLLCAASDLSDDDGLSGYVIVAADISYNKKLEFDLRRAQKLESVGQLAAGIAHEINTPIQFIGDNLTFLMEAFEDTQQVREHQNAIRAAAVGASIATESVEKLDAVTEEIDLEFLDEEVPAALSRAIEGVARVAKIVRAMKEFAHPGSEDLQPVDLNRSIETTLTVAKGEMRAVQKIETDFESLPTVHCFEGDVNQVLLNMVVNAAHAIESREDSAAGPGKLRISTSTEGEMAVIDIEDNGTGIPDEIKERIFDPFFTTKGVGSGTGQGLALAHKVIVERHGGVIDVETEVGRGTRFIIRLPIDPRHERTAA